MKTNFILEAASACLLVAISLGVTHIILAGL